MMMSHSTDLTEALPYLRRYAHALAGNRSKGDAYVKLCLETCIAEPECLSGVGGIKVRLFALFHEVWSVVALTLPQLDEDMAEGSGLDDPLADALQSLPVLKRQVFLLGRLEGFSAMEIANILGIDDADARRRLDEATALLRRRMIDRHLLQGGFAGAAEAEDGFEVPLQAPSFARRATDSAPTFQR